MHRYQKILNEMQEWLVEINLLTIYSHYNLVYCDDLCIFHCFIDQIMNRWMIKVNNSCSLKTQPLRSGLFQNCFISTLWSTALTFEKKPMLFILFFPPVAPRGGWQFPASEPQSLPAQPWASDPGGWGDERRQESVMRRAVGSSAAAALALGQSSLECCLSLK